MTSSSALALFTAMFVLALIPGPCVIVITARAMASGFSHGAVTAAGALLGDFIFILLCVFGLSVLAQQYSEIFFVIKYLGAAYLLWLGVQLLLAGKSFGAVTGVRESSYLNNALTGLLTVFSNPKAILFYVSFFPAFVDIADLNGTDVTAILLIATLSFGSVNLGFAWIASKAGTFTYGSQSGRALKFVSGAVLICGSALLATNT